ncbi:MAG: DUF3298 domain-containing protein [Candidatus Delongbacteria bacterium]|nr:DUF3298 domain-containing protein [Candidatus Cloacimonadota bacterium]MCB9474886.1 DUF3298 domain-containing protein [Candidatus Delongbacteria bacterium]
MLNSTLVSSFRTLLPVLALLVAGVSAQADPDPDELLPVWTNQDSLLVDHTLVEVGRHPEFRIEASWPELRTPEPRDSLFALAVEALAHAQLQDFRSLLPPAHEPSIGVGSALDMGWSATMADSTWLSVKLFSYFYWDGAAHGMIANRSLTWLRPQARDLELEQLFRPGTSWDTAIGDYCTRVLRERLGEMFFDDRPLTADDFHAWNLLPGLMLITFDPYRVGPWAAGEQAVAIPLDSLSTLLDPGLPLEMSSRSVMEE